nr:hypothetical protein [Tanacetum cinerariifolium]
MDSDLNIQDDQWKLSLDIDDSDLRLTPVLSKLRKQSNIHEGGGDSVLSTQEYMKKVVEDVGDIKKFLNNGKPDQVVAIAKSCSLNVIGDLTVIMKDLSGTIPETIHHKVIDEGGYEKDITVGAALILANVSVFSPKPSMNYLNITKRNVVKVFRKDTVPGSGGGIVEEEEKDFYILVPVVLVLMVAQNTNNTTIRSILLAEKLTGLNFINWYRNLMIVLRYDKKMKFMEQPIGLALDPETADLDTIDKYYEPVNYKQEVACLMTSIKAFHACKQEAGQSVSSYLLKMKSYLDTLERLGYAMPKELGVRSRRIGRNRKGAKGKAKGKNKLAYAPKTKIPSSPKRDNPKRNIYATTARRLVIGGGIVHPTMLRLKGSRKLKHEALSLYMGNGIRAVVEAIGSFDLILSSGLIIVLDNCHFAPTVTRGGEYLSHEFVNHMKSYGIISQLTPPYTPQHNRVSGRWNRTLLDIVQSMMSLTTLPKSFWGYALETVARILNMVPNKKVDKTPYEIWHEKAPKLSYLRVWGYFESDKWLEAMNTEMQSMKDNQVWYLVDLPSNGQLLDANGSSRRRLTWMEMYTPLKLF